MTVYLVAILAVGQTIVVGAYNDRAACETARTQQIVLSKVRTTSTTYGCLEVQSCEGRKP